MSEQSGAEASPELAVSDTTRVRRLPDRQRTDRAVLEEILDEALVAHVAYVRDGSPVVLPFACARDGDWLLLHGSTGAGLLRACATGQSISQPISVAITHVDALVVARSTFDNSMNYRSAVVFGVPEVLTGAEHERALQVLVDHLLPGRWDEVRPSTRKELAATSVLRLPLDEVSVKVRAAGPSVSDDDGEDRAAWAGLVPLRTTLGEPLPDGSVPPAQSPPASVERARERFDGSRHRLAEPAD